MLRDVFIFVLGGVTFLPLCFLGGFLYFLLTCPPVARDDKATERPVQELTGDVDLSPERKAEALDLAVAASASSASGESTGRLAESASTVQSLDVASSGASSTGVEIPSSAKRLLPQRNGKGTAAAAPFASKHFRSGFLTVRRQFFPTGSAEAAASRPGAAAASNGDAAEGSHDDKKQSGGYMSAVYRGLLDYRKGQHEQHSAEVKDASGSMPGGMDGAHSAPVTKNQVAKEYFRAILKGPILYLYSAEDPLAIAPGEVQAAIDLRGKRVSVYMAGLGDVQGEPGADSEEIHLAGEADADGSAAAASATTPEEVAAAEALAARAKQLQHDRIVKKWKSAAASVRDGELFMKRNAVRIVGQLSPAVSGLKASRGGAKQFTEWFVFAKSATLLEDWYHALFHASLLPPSESTSPQRGADADSFLPFLPTTDPVGPLFSNMDMSTLLASLDTVPDPIPLRWLNAMLGRIFFSIYRTAWLEDYVTAKLMKKISRVKMPSFLSDVRVREVDLGRTPPAFSRPMLKSLTGEGEASMEVTLHYTGSLRLTISTNLTISLGSRFKSYTVSLLLAVVLRSLEGNMLLHIKPPPSNRLWFGFTQMPKMDLAIEPVVSERKVQWSMVTRIIESRIREMMMESLVLPHMDDVPFFDTRPMAQRGGLWADAAKRADQPTQPTQDTSVTGATTASSGHNRQPSAQGTPLDSAAADTVTSQSGFSSAVETGSMAAAPDDAPRSRRAKQVASTSSQPLTAADTLSSLLSRDAAKQSLALQATADVGSGQGTPSKRKSWFTGSSRLGAPASSTSASAPVSRKASQVEPAEQLFKLSESSVGAGSSVKSMPIAGPDVSITGAAPQNAARGSSSTSGLDLPDDSDVFPRVASPAPLEQVVAEEGGLHPVTSKVSTASTDSGRSASRRQEASRAVSTQPDHSDSFARNGPSVILTPAQQARYDAARQSERSQGLALGGLAGQNVSGALLSSWNKAKASLADKDSRQAAAKDAKDAMKRGWATFQSRRQGQTARDAGISAANANVAAVNQALHERGFMLPQASSETAASDIDGAHPTTAIDHRARALLSDHDGSSHPTRADLIRDGDRIERGRERTISASSSRSSSVSRQSYREHRAERAAEAAKAASPVMAIPAQSGSRAFVPAAPIAITSVASRATELSSDDQTPSRATRVAEGTSERSPHASPSATPMKVQPKRSAMMAVPGMSAAAKASPQSLASIRPASPPAQTSHLGSPVETASPRPSSTAKSSDTPATLSQSPPAVTLPFLEDMAQSDAAAKESNAHAQGPDTISAASPPPATDLAVQAEESTAINAAGPPATTETASGEPESQPDVASTLGWEAESGRSPSTAPAQDQSIPARDSQTESPAVSTSDTEQAARQQSSVSATTQLVDEDAWHLDNDERIHDHDEPVA